MRKLGPLYRNGPQNHILHSCVCASGFFWLRQLRPFPQSVNWESAATLVNAFVSSGVDYCNAVFFTGLLAPQPTGCNGRRTSPNVRVVSGSRGLHTELHWLDVPQRVKYKLGVLLYRCQQNQRQTTERQFPASRFIIVCALPAVISSSCRAIPV